ncbi:MAG: nicotinate-nucleotide adenylyltransferase [Candidatus Limnocylindrales bacterium]
MTGQSSELDLRGAHGIFGGTFDPIHLAHLAVAEAARDDLGLASVTFIPAGEPPHKVGRQITAAHHRLAMVEAAIADNPGFRVSRVEVDRAGPSYTVDTLSSLSAAGEGPLVLIMSMDSYLDLPTWREPARVLELATLAVAPRDGFEAAGPEFLIERVPGAAARTRFLAGPHLRLSASELRDRAAVGRSLRYLVPDAVAAYIGDHGLYLDRVDAHTRVPARDLDHTRRMDPS